MSNFDSIDDWFEKGFRVQRQRISKNIDSSKRDQIRSASQTPIAARGQVKFSKNAKANNIKSVIQKAPEVMVKITGNSKGLKTVKNHLDYISRNGDIELEDESGCIIQGKSELKGLKEQFKASQIPEESTKREFLHVMFSMPAGTSPEAVRQSVSEFCREEFSNRRYVMALHDDTDHAHVHVCVGTRDIDRADEPRLSPRKNDLYRWRQGFADKLRENGVDAAASERRHRFNFRRPENAIVRQIRAESPNSPVFKPSTKQSIKPRTPKVFDGLKTELKTAIQTGNRPENPARERIEKTKLQILNGWQNVEKDLIQQNESELAQGVQSLINQSQTTNATRSRNQELFDHLTLNTQSKQSNDEQQKPKTQSDLEL